MKIVTIDGKIDINKLMKPFFLILSITIFCIGCSSSGMFSRFTKEECQKAFDESKLMCANDPAYFRRIITYRDVKFSYTGRKDFLLSVISNLSDGDVEIDFLYELFDKNKKKIGEMKIFRKVKFLKTGYIEEYHNNKNVYYYKLKKYKIR